ncbi:MAG: SDR family oxidoreductase [Pseudomonadota bacterium]|nr:SDR family oxidoreductase [Pseudomonadota bacterium]
MALPNQRVLITGCSSGIGRALAVEFHRRGHDVIATARRVEALADLAEKGMSTRALDVCDEGSIRQVIAGISADGGGLDMVVNNAGYGAMGPVAELPMVELRRQFETNVFGPVALIQACLPLLLASRSARVVNVGSVSGILTTPFAGAYCATKSALHSLSDALRIELSPFGIDVITVQPGAIRSRFGDNASAAVERTRNGDSLYAPVSEGILARAQASQVRSTPAEDMAGELADKVLRARPPHTVRIGVGSRLMPFIRYALPTRVRDFLMRRQFKLDRLASHSSSR